MCNDTGMLPWSSWGQRATNQVPAELNDECEGNGEIAQGGGDAVSGSARTCKMVKGLFKGDVLIST